MPDPIEPKEEKKDELAPGTPSPDDTFVGKRDRVKTITQIAKESQARIRKQYLEDLEKKEAEAAKKEEKPEEKSEEKPVEEPKPEEKKEEPKIEPKVVTEDEAKRLADEAAKKAAEETSKEFQGKIDEILNKDKTLQEKQKEADELISAWDKEGRLPKDYAELISETMRIADAKMEQRQKAIEEKAAEERKAQEEAKNKEVEDKKAQEQKALEDYNKQIATDLDEIISAKLLPRPADINEINNPETKDEAAKEIQKVFKFGIELNTKLKAEGKTPVTSLNKIFFLHYKPFVDANPAKKSEQPAGADAPVSGSEHTTPDTPTDKIPYAQLHKETWPQTISRLKKEALQRLRAKQ